jgi:hypothetical protein
LAQKNTLREKTPISQDKIDILNKEANTENSMETDPDLILNTENALLPKDEAEDKE